MVSDRDASFQAFLERLYDHHVVWVDIHVLISHTLGYLLTVHRDRRGWSVLIAA